MIIYRACCLEEYNKHLKLEAPPLCKRFIFFSQNLEHIQKRVRDGKFNNSGLVSGKYDFVVTYEIPDDSIKYFKNVGRNELMLDRRNFQLIKWRLVCIK